MVTIMNKRIAISYVIVTGLVIMVWSGPIARRIQAENHKRINATSGYALCPKCGEPPSDDHMMWYAEQWAISDLHERCWRESSVAERCWLHLKFMREYKWPEDKQVLVLRATLEGK